MTSASRATPNLPSGDFDATAAFYAKIGFENVWRDAAWMIVRRDGVSLEFFLHSDLDPSTSWFSCCLRLDDADAFYSACLSAGVENAKTGCPRLHPLQLQPWGARAGALIDPDGTLLRIIQN